MSLFISFQSHENNISTVEKEEKERQEEEEGENIPLLTIRERQVAFRGLNNSLLCRILHVTPVIQLVITARRKTR